MEKLNYFIRKIGLWIILVLIVLTITVVSIKYYIDNKQYYDNYSYYGNKLSEYEPIFKLNTLSLKDCQEKCIKTPNCKGITLNALENICYGTGNDGVLREEEDSKVWLKDKDIVFSYKTELLLVETDSKQVVDKSLIKEGYSPNHFNYNFYVYLNKFEPGTWKHIFHKGTEISNDIDTNNWENISSTIPEQYIGAWFAPFNTTMRIAYTLKNRKIGYVDIPNIPIKKLVFVSVNIFNKYIEVYLDGKIVKITNLNTEPVFNYGDLYVKNNNTFNGSVLYLTYNPEYLNHKTMMELYKKSYSEVEKEIMKKY